MEYYKSIAEPDLVELINSTKKSLFLCLPAIHKDVADAIDKLDKSSTFMGNKEVDIHILLDFDSQTFRQGYGNIKAVRGLVKGDSEVKSLTDNRISFVIADDIGYYLFIESRSLIPADKKTINAIQIDPVSIVRLKNYFFNDSIKANLEDEMTNAIIEESVKLKEIEKIIPEQIAPIQEISKEKIKEVSINLEQNPPLQPDYKRIVEFYSSKFQYAELHFEGQNFKHYSINIPSNLLPYKNEELRKKLITKLKLFENITDNKDFEPFKDIVSKKKEISKKYIVNLSCRRGKGILKMTDKIPFQKEVNELSEVLKKYKSSLYKSMLKEIEIAREGLVDTLSVFFRDNPSDEMKGMSEADYPLIAKNIANDLIYRIKIPDPTKWINSFQIDTNYSDIAYEDLSDKKLLAELNKNKIIDKDDDTRIAVFGTGIALK